MKGKYRKIYKKRILNRIVARAYYTHQGVSQRGKEPHCDTLFLMENQSVVISLPDLWFGVCSCSGIRAR